MKGLIDLLDEEIFESQGYNLVTPSSVSLQMAKEAGNKLMSIPRFKDLFNSVQIKFSNQVGGVGTYMNGSGSTGNMSPIILVDENELEQAVSKYGKDLKEQFLITVYHEFCHAIQERMGKEFNENQAESFADSLLKLGTIPDDIQDEILNWRKGHD